MDTLQTIKANFEYFKIRNGLTIHGIAKEKGVTRQTIYSYFRDGITLNTLEKIAALVHCQPYELLQPRTDTGAQDEGPQTAAIRCPHCRQIIRLSIQPGDDTQGETDGQKDSLF